MKKMVSFAVLMITAFTAYAQKVTFYSPEFEDGVRHHVGLNQSEEVLQTHTDTITSLNLSGMAISDIRDVVYLPVVTNLDLSYNSITDISPLLALESLSELDLKNNKLESINILAFMQTESMQVNVANNYISDFSFFYSPTQCDFTLIGMDMQQVKDAPYFDLYQLYAHVNSDGQPVVSYRGYTNMMSAANLKCGANNVAVQLDGKTYTVALEGNFKETAKVTIANGEKEETTYVVPPLDYYVEAGKTMTMDTGLPEGYELTSAVASEGTVEIVGSSLKYTAPATAVADVVSFNYYKGSTLKGFSRFYLNRGSNPGDANGDGKVSIADVIAIISHILGEPPSDFNKTAADINSDGEVTVADAIQLFSIIIQGQ